MGLYGNSLSSHTTNFKLILNIHKIYYQYYDKLYKAVPWKRLIKDFGIREKIGGRPFVFPAQGRLALIFLKNYSGLSDKRLIEQLNGNIE